MNKDNIKKALKCCAGIDDCDDCPYDVVRSCSDRLKLDARELITEQEKEIERLKDEDTRLTEKLKQVLLAVDTVKEMNAMCEIDEQRKRAVQDFADKLKTRFEEKEQHYICMYDWNGHSAVVDCANEVDELLKEYEK